jgi:tellurite resistance protein
MNDPSVSTETSKLRYLPVPLFATVMGLAGLTLAWEKARAVLAPPIDPSPVLVPVTLTVMALLLVGYAAKLIRYPLEVRKEFNHPVKMNFFGAISIGLILSGTVLAHGQLEISLWLWGIGTAAHFILTVTVMSIWINHETFEIHHINPAWFIPVVGNILVPIAGVHHGFIEISWFFFSIGILFWLVLMTIMFYRFIFHQPLVARLLPTLFILLAPPAVGFLAWLKLSGGTLDSFGRILYYSAAFILVLLIMQLGKFARLGFFLSWWAYSFPFAAFTVATMAMAEQLQSNLFRGLSYLLLALCTVLILGLVIVTLRAMHSGKVFIEEA